MGLDKDWVYSGTRRTANYTFVPPGGYTFRVKGSNSNGVWNERGATIKITVLPPWWMTLWFRSLSVMVGALCIFAFFQIRTRSIRNQNNRLRAAVAEGTRELVQKNMELTRQGEEIATQNEEITSQNEELVSQQEEISSQRDQLEKQNQKLEESKRVIAQHNQHLETTVQQRTLQLATSNEELKKQFHQLEQFSFIAAHNLRAPVARILGLANVFNIMGPAHSGNAEVLGHIVKSTQDLDTVVHDLGAILNTRPGVALQREPIVIPELVNKIIGRFAREIAEHNVSVQTDLQVGEFNSVPAYIDSIVSNLLSNSIKYRAQERKCVIKVSVVPVAGGVAIKVEDNGIGFDAEGYANKLFEPFQRFHTHVEGKGLGMYLVKTQAEALGGQVEVTSVLDKGTSVVISLPNSSS
ncbi:MAG: ATP-binding protein [Flammeovirgaceae bacterium]